MSETSQKTKTPTGMIYTKKITTACGWVRSMAALIDPASGEVLRPAMEPTLLMRVKGYAQEGWVETSDFGDFIRWIGTFQADAPQRDGTVLTYISRNLILPPVAADALAMAMMAEQVETNIKNRTGEVYKPANDFAQVPFMFDIYLVAPQSGGEAKKSATGYEYQVRPIVEAQSMTVLDKIGDGAPPLPLPAPAELENAEGPVPGPVPSEAQADPVVEEKPHGKRKAS